MTGINATVNEVHIWDTDMPYPSAATTILWQLTPEEGQHDTYSISRLVEQGADLYRQQYLDWIYRLGETEINGKKVVEHLLLKHGLSYWWMGALAQKFNLSAQSGIHDALKTMALEAWISQRDIRQLTLFSENEALAECLQSMCLKKGIQYQRQYTGRSVRKPGIRFFYRKLPLFCQAMFSYTRYFLRVAPLLFSKRRHQTVPFGKVMFVDILVHLDQKALSRGEFFSNYWTGLIQKLNKWKTRCTWLHLFFPHPAIPSHTAARRNINLFNRNAQGTQFHVLLENALGFGTFWQGLLDYLKLRGGVSTIKPLQDVPLGNSSLNVWPLLENEWKNSVLGGEAIINCLRISLFEKALRNIPVQKLGIYIAENQPWEMALLHAWKACGHQTIVGVPHTATRFWDLRYFHDPRCYNEQNDDVRMPQPDLFAVNGSVMHNNLISAGYPASRLVAVEALRFLHLEVEKPDHLPHTHAERPFTVLICGDFLAKTTRKMMLWISAAARQLPTDIHYILKPHPAYPVTDIVKEDLKLSITNLPLSELLNESDVVFASDTTSAAVDAYCSGVSVIVMWDGNGFNFSPLRDARDAHYVSTATELGEALGKARRDSGKVERGNDVKLREFFYTGNELERWKDLIDTYITMP